MMISFRAFCLSAVILVTGVGPAQAQFCHGVVRTPEGKTDPLVAAITSVVAPHTWDESGGPGTIMSLDAWGLLVVSQTEEVHEEIGILLDQVRLAKTQQEGAHGPQTASQTSLVVERPEASRARELIEAKLESKADFQFIDAPLDEVFGFIAEKHAIPVVIDRRALEEIGIDTKIPLTLSLRGISLRSALRLLLRDLDLTYSVRDEVMQITSCEFGEARLLTRIYKVKDLLPATQPEKSTEE